METENCGETWEESCKIVEFTEIAENCKSFGDFYSAKKGQRLLLEDDPGPCCTVIITCSLFRLSSSLSADVRITITVSKSCLSVTMEPLLDARSKLKLMDKIENKESINIGKKMTTNEISLLF